MEEEEGDGAHQAQEAQQTHDTEGLQSEPVRIVAQPKLAIPSDTFGLKVVDEAYQLKNPSSLQATAVRLLDCEGIFCTATPCTITVWDFAGILTAIWPLVKDRIADAYERPSFQSYPEMYKTFERDYACDITAVAQLGEAQLALYLLALDPEAFCQHITQTTAVNTDVAANIVPLPTSILCLRRVLRQSIRVHRHDIELGKGILHFQITFVELRQAKVEAAQYRSIHQRTMQTAAVRCGSADDEVTWTNPKRWILQQAVANRLLDLFTYRNVNLSAKTICAQQAKGLDSFEYFYTYTKESLNVMPLTDRIGMAWYLCQPSAKCCYLVSELLYIVVEKKHKLIIYADWPRTL
ncbi:hypothetical protein LTR91_017999 [Friedmanniomyces endolithicus]|uniref:Uncharacterized protein n=1 Tax=Friedmanniomyces endolithicus TaxID=329885 RepID=A0AAN6HD79_9PEZI|nr:hypothetical protein LTR94_008642 [Friedmanniomyces endolithicus]KAK0791209.1 hypothetical protein LTR59_008933 [Friedmanniomyces endolithicus]KAK0797470.1 hypothetical protein LTR38_008172 [Friedmanniomyces endolithicus]KAK0839290.1 hypothetical protein LTR03_011364 [Friedmanniomyces endolithicus]KAK0857137.1 hypothetical protein LTS02_010348 [Friedmanniomyces endolithicus]